MNDGELEYFPSGCVSLNAPKSKQIFQQELAGNIAVQNPYLICTLHIRGSFVTITRFYFHVFLTFCLIGKITTGKFQVTNDTTRCYYEIITMK